MGRFAGALPQNLVVGQLSLHRDLEGSESSNNKRNSHPMTRTLGQRAPDLKHKAGHQRGANSRVDNADQKFRLESEVESQRKEGLASLAM